LICSLSRPALFPSIGLIEIDFFSVFQREANKKSHSPQSPAPHGLYNPLLQIIRAFSSSTTEFAQADTHDPTVEKKQSTEDPGTQNMSRPPGKMGRTHCNTQMSPLVLSVAFLSIVHHAPLALPSTRITHISSSMICQGWLWIGCLY
jgi:hypothetical protein